MERAAAERAAERAEAERAAAEQAAAEQAAEEQAAADSQELASTEPAAAAITDQDQEPAQEATQPGPQVPRFPRHMSSVRRCPTGRRWPLPTVPPTRLACSHPMPYPGSVPSQPVPAQVVEEEEEEDYEPLQPVQAPVSGPAGAEGEAGAESPTEAALQPKAGGPSPPPAEPLSASPAAGVTVV